MGSKVPKKTTLAQLPPSLSAQPPQSDPADHKRKRDQKGQEATEGGKGPLPKEVEAQRGAKLAKTGLTLADKRAEAQIEPLAWTLKMVLDGALLLANASIRNF